MSAPVWHDHLHRRFRVARTFEEPRPSAVDMAVPCSKIHPPPEVLFRRGEQSGWNPDLDEFEIPDLSVLEGVVCCQFQKLVLLQGSMLSLFLLLSMRACL